MKAFAVLSLLVLFFITPQLSVRAQNLILTEFDTSPIDSSLAQGIRKAKFSGDDLYIQLGGRLWKKPYQQDWIQLPVDTSFNLIRSFDVNSHGQIIAKVDSNNVFTQKLLTSDDDFQSFKTQDDQDGSLNYIAKDTIILISGLCGDVLRDKTKYSIDGGETWVQTNFNACNFSGDYLRRGDEIHWYGNFGSKSGGPGSPLTLYSHQSFSLEDFEGKSTIYSTNANYTERFNYIINNNGSKYIHQLAFDRDTLFDVDSYYSTTLEGDLVQVGEGSFGTLRNGPKGNDVFLINNAFDNSKIYYKENPQDDFVELTINLDSIGLISNILYRHDKIYFIGQQKIYTSNGIGLYDQKINGHIYYDLDDNCQYEVGKDSLIEDVVLDIDLSDGSSFTSHFHNGEYEFLAPLGQTEVNINNIDSEVWASCQNNSAITLTSAGEVKSVDFGLMPVKQCQDLRLDVATFNLTRCFENLLLLKVENLGTEMSTDVNLTLTLDSFLELNSMDRNYTALGDNKFSIEFGDLNISQEAYVRVLVNVSCDSDLGQEHCVDLQVETQNACFLGVNQFSECAPNVGSYDPNDIQLFDDAGVLQSNFVKDEFFYYKVRFQNTGTAQAFHVRVTNAVPAELDLSTFELLSSSHEGQVSFSANRTMEMRFDNINLPDSTTNFIESQGYLKYRIKPVSDTEEGTEIFNEANIYFDFNDPVLTNEAFGVISVSSSSVSTIYQDIMIFPNPTSGLIHVAYEHTLPLEATVIDMMGREVVKKKVHLGTINVEGLPAGTYVLKLLLDDGPHNQVFVIR